MSGSGDDGVSRGFIKDVIEDFLPARAYDEGVFIRVVRRLIFVPLIGGILTIGRPIIDGILVLFRGSIPGGNAATDPYWGLADLIDYFATTAFDVVRVVIESYFDLILLVPRAIFGPDPGPFIGLVVLVIVVAEIVITVELLRRGVLALAAAINLDSVTTLVFGGDG